MKVLVVGGGGREHALVWKIHQDNPEVELYCAPGNPGIAQLADRVPIAPEEIQQLADFATELGIDLTVVREATVNDLQPSGPIAPILRRRVSPAVSLEAVGYAGDLVPGSEVAVQIHRGYGLRRSLFIRACGRSRRHRGGDDDEQRRRHQQCLGHGAGR